jgi:hypothetical protein
MMWKQSRGTLFEMETAFPALRNVARKGGRDQKSRARLLIKASLRGYHFFLDVRRRLYGKLDL